MLFLLFLKDGSTALFKAAIKGHNSVIEELLKFSPSLGLLKVGGVMAVVLFLLLTAQHWIKSRFIFINYWRIPVFICCLQNGSTALHAAVMGGNHHTVLLLLGASADPTLPNKVESSWI